MINAAKSGQTITFEFGEWNSFCVSNLLLFILII